MADQTKKGDSGKRLDDAQRFKYIGFEVFPGKPKDLFKNDAEKKLYEEKVARRRDQGELVREDCTLFVDRVSMGEKILLTVASLLIIAALFLPFYSAYVETEVVNESAAATTPSEQAGMLDSIAQADPALADSIATAESILDDTLTAAAPTEDVIAEPDGEVVDSNVETAPAPAREGVSIDEQGNEVITGMVEQKKYVKEYARVSGIGSLLKIGTLGSHIFSSGFILMLTGFIYLLYTLACIALPVLALYTLYGTKAKGDELALQVKKVLKLAWWPVAAFVLTIFLSFVGADYGFTTTDMFTSIGDSYHTGVLLDTLSFGVVISLAGFIVLAAKGSEI